MKKILLLVIVTLLVVGVTYATPMKNIKMVSGGCNVVEMVLSDLVIVPSTAECVDLSLPTKEPVYVSTVSEKNIKAADAYIALPKDDAWVPNTTLVLSNQAGLNNNFQSTNNTIKDEASSQKEDDAWIAGTTSITTIAANMANILDDEVQRE